MRTRSTVHPQVAEDMVGITVGGVLMLLVYAGGPLRLREQ